MGVSSNSEAAERQRANLVPAPPAPEGNTRRLVHGARARSDRHVAERAAELAEQVAEANPHLDRTRDGAAIERYAVQLARVEACWLWLSEQDDFLFADRRKGKVHPLYDRLTKWEGGLDRMEDRLAISPRVRFELAMERPPSGPPAVDRAVVTDPEVRAAARRLVEAAARARAGSANQERAKHLEHGGNYE